MNCFRHLQTAGLSLCGLGILSGCRGLQSAQSVVDPGGVQAARIAHLWWFIFGVCAVAFVLTIIAMSVAVWRRRETPVENFHPVSEEKTKTQVVTGAIALTVIILFAFLITSAVTGKANASLSSKNPIAIEVTGHQWWWEV